MTIWISRGLPLFKFEQLNMFCVWFLPTCDKLWLFEFNEIFRCLILSVSIYYVPESEFRVKSYDHLSFLRAFVVQFRASRNMIRLNQTFKWKVMTIWISREHPLFNFERLKNVMRLNRTSEWKVMTIWISRELALFNFERVGMWCTWIAHPS